MFWVSVFLWVTSKGLGLFSWGCWALGPNCKREMFRSSLYWKL